MENASEQEEKAFCDAVWDGDHERVAAMLDTGKFDPNGFRHLYGKATHLHAAACRGFEKIVKILIEHHANPNAPLVRQPLLATFRRTNTLGICEIRAPSALAASASPSPSFVWFSLR
eukprot:TRINITY_DN3762_c0_g1_i1.p1 TRINITY_DN3762_c0_g1~~TRINITY_DN3762_c0_g1_i1.p1  ORF type:complete len:126 (+),score=17.14 TRINITY_DN3762_c0_g1_i1:29-379(+)